MHIDTIKNNGGTSLDSFKNNLSPIAMADSAMISTQASSLPPNRHSTFSSHSSFLDNTPSQSLRIHDTAE
jgi:hypothetical protein